MKTLTLKTSLLFLSFFIACGASLAQTAAPQQKITGALINEQGKPMDYATVSLLNAKDSTNVKGTLSNESGLYIFDHVKAGTYIIKATVVGYDKALSQPFTVDANAFAVPVLKFQQASHALNTVTVTATKPLIEHKIDRTVMNVENSVLAAGNSAMEILERAPGVTIDKDDNISLKGKQGVTVMINDKLTYLTSAQLATLLRSTDGTTIQSIEIITNPSARYDAAGNSGIINIKLKKNKQSGTNGSLTAGIGYGAHFNNNESLSLNHKEGGLNIFGSFSHNDRGNLQDIAIERIIPSTTGLPTYFRQTSPFDNSNHNNSYRLGADYDLSSKNTLGFVVSGYFNGEVDKVDDHTYIGKSFTEVDSTLTTLSTVRQLYHNIAFNLNDSYKLDTLGQQISADLDYSLFKNNSDSKYMTNYYYPQDGTPYQSAFLGNLTPSVIDIHTGKVDYTKPLGKTLKFESGLKFSDVKTDNNLTETLAQGDPYLSTNHFVYDEKVEAGYINFNKDFKHFSVQAGLRAEYTRSNATGDSAHVVSNIARNYLDFFPSVFLSHTFNDKNDITFSYSRRIDRPQYDNLNPFVFHIDPYTYQKGNPFLRPQYTNNFEFNYTYNKNITLTLGYSKTTDVITELPGTDPATKVSFITQANLQIQNAYSANLYAPYTITKWWEGSINANTFYLGFKSANLDGANLDRGQFAYNIRATETLTPFTGYKVEVTGHYQSDLTYGLYDVKARYSIDAGVSHSFYSKKLNVKASMSDIFNTLTNNVNSQYQNTELFITQKRESRITRLTVTYNFGNSKIKARNHQTGADEEKGRVKGAN